MDLSGEYNIDAKRQDVWEALNNPEILKNCIPGCEELEKLSDTQFATKVIVKVGAIKARLKGNVELSDIDTNNSYTISGQGQGGVAGFAKVVARVNLEDDEGSGTVLRYKATAELGGKLAAVGSRVIQGISKKMADDFFGKFARHFSGEKEEVQTKVTVKSVLQNENAALSPAPAIRGTELPGTVRDLIWLSIGVAVGFGMTWAYYS